MLIYWFLQNHSTAASENIRARLSAHQAAWIHWIQAARGASGSITMVVMFAVCLCWVMRSHLSYIKKVPEHNLKVRILPYYKVNMCTILTHIGVHHTVSSSLDRYHPGRGHLSRCTRLLGTNGCILESRLIVIGRHDGKLLQAWLWHRSGSCRLWWSLISAAILLMLNCPSSRECTCLSQVSLWGCQSTE